MPFKMISLFPINTITDRPRGRDDLRTQRREGELGGVGGRKKITKGSQCMKCLPFSENAPVTISVMASSAGIVLSQERKTSRLSLRIGNSQTPTGTTT